MLFQVRVFRPAPEGVRRCIVATNVAETSITGVRERAENATITAFKMIHPLDAFDLIAACSNNFIFKLILIILIILMI